MNLTCKRHFLTTTHPCPDAVRKHKKDATLPKIISLYHKTIAINPENKYLLSINDKHAETFYAVGVRRVWFIANEQGRL